MALCVTLLLLISSSNFSLLLNQKISYRKIDESFLQYGTPQSGVIDSKVTVLG